MLYDLRHTFGTRQATEEKTDPFTLPKIMGHANLRTIMKYVHPDEDAQREAMKRYADAIQRKKIGGQITMIPLNEIERPILVRWAGPDCPSGSDRNGVISKATAEASVNLREVERS